MATSPIPHISEEEYLRLERAAFEKSEYHDGEIFAMSGRSPNHSFIKTQAVAMLARQTPKGCRPFDSDLRIKIPDKKQYLYADGGLICGDPSVFNEDNLLNPCLIIEVLSPSTEGYDRGKKFELYRQIPSFTDYLVIHHDRRHVEHYGKQDDGGWLLHEYTGVASFRIPRWNVEVPLQDLYSTAMGLEDEAE